MIVESKGMQDEYFTWIETGFALPADDSSVLVTIKDRAGEYIGIGFYDGTGWYGYKGKPLTGKEKCVTAWAHIAPFKKETKRKDGEEA